GVQEKDEPVRALRTGESRPVRGLREDERDARAVLDGRGPGAVVVRPDDHRLVVGAGQLAHHVVAGDRLAGRVDLETGAHPAPGRAIAPARAAAYPDPPACDRPRGAR